MKDYNTKIVLQDDNCLFVQQTTDDFMLNLKNIERNNLPHFVYCRDGNDIEFIININNIKVIISREMNEKAEQIVLNSQ